MQCSWREKKSKHESDVHHSKRNIQEIRINTNEIATNGNLKQQGEVSVLDLMLFPGDIISIKVKAGDGMKGGLLGYISYVDEDKKTTKLTTNKEQWVCDKAVPRRRKEYRFYFD